MDEANIMAVAHRGASAYAPENTVAAFDEAVRLGAAAVELDVRLTADGIPVCLHDDTLDRTTTGRGPVVERQRFDLLRLDAGSWLHPRFAGTRIPTLEEALVAITPSAIPVLELKVPIAPALLLEILARHNAVEDALVISFDPQILRDIRMYTPRIDLGLLAEAWSETLIQDAQGLDASVLVLSTEILGPQRIVEADAAGLEVWTFTANDVATVAACAALGVTGIITDRPDLIRHK